MLNTCWKYNNGHSAQSSIIKMNVIAAEIFVPYKNLQFLLYCIIVVFGGISQLIMLDKFVVVNYNKVERR